MFDSYQTQNCIDQTRNDLLILKHGETKYFYQKNSCNVFFHKYFQYKCLCKIPHQTFLALFSILTSQQKQFQDDRNQEFCQQSPQLVFLQQKLIQAKNSKMQLLIFQDFLFCYYQIFSCFWMEINRQEGNLDIFRKIKINKLAHTTQIRQERLDFKFIQFNQIIF
ncbi:hypothetical protein TTHERM_000753305 (macronuclear) [Tetrahymena thermophila SB210]|uniref:Uncharacterized protein n=1 Tax=Tetrahymena thermophila (strain SB210) TaxID=312017 RepID=W7X8Z8_TETTS|nr:hypothetical protein TTHERM_000753305 [Tetrahymena thermophila SB210]EWS73817.1 hypothetical protein TTHERM_000753305 [Tetrahymena thermophila SB210]|eukprot:XP_012653640.1 hypothetical protein TTHERM_000753305 [Tetrahymena thermophila SB210]